MDLLGYAVDYLMDNPKYPRTMSFKSQINGYTLMVKSFKVKNYVRMFGTASFSYEISGVQSGGVYLNLTGLCCDKKGNVIGSFPILESVSSGVPFKFRGHISEIPAKTAEFRFQATL